MSSHSPASSTARAVITLRSATDGPTLVLVPGVEGLTSAFRTLADLAPGGSVISFQAPGLEQGERPLESVPALAAYFVAALGDAGITGPLVLAGYSFGAQVAYAMARRLAAAGGSVRALWLVDPAMPARDRFDGPPLQRVPDRREVADWIAAALGHAFVAAPTAVDPLADLAASLVANDPADVATLRDALARRLAVITAHIRASEADCRTLNPEPSVVAAPITIFRAAVALDSPFRNAAGWAARPDFGEDLGWGVASQAGARVVRVPGDHLTMLRPPHVQALAAAMSAALAADPPTGPHTPLSHAQLRLWFLQKQRPADPTYQVFYAVGIDGPIDEAALAAAWQACVVRHAPLRTEFGEHDGLPWQQARDDIGAPLTIEDDALDDGPEAAVERWLAAQRIAPLALIGQPLVRAVLLRRRGSHLLLLRMHHLIVDGWSAHVLLRDLAGAYAARVHGAAEPTPLGTTYAAFVAAEQAWLGSPAAAAARDFWGEQLAGLPVLQLPTDAAPPSERTTDGDRLRLSLPADLVAALDRLAAAEGCSRFIVLLCAWAVLLHRITGQTDFGVGTFAANRSDAAEQALIGCFASTLVLRCGLAGDPAFRALLGAHAARLRAGLVHQKLPYDEVVKRAGGAGLSGLDPLIQAAFVSQKAPPGTIDVPGTRWHIVKLCPDGSAPDTAKFDLTLSVETTDDGVTGMLSYSADLFTRDRIERMIAQYLQILRHVAAAPDTPLSRIDLLPAGERAAILRAANDAPRVFAPETLTAWFAAQVAQRPDAPAVTCASETLTYAALDARAAALAHQLLARGVTPGSIVGVCLPRSLDLCVALLGVLMAGAAYLPLDPAYPQERLGMMLADAGASLVVTTEALAERVAAAAPVFVEPDARASAPPAVVASPDDLAYVIYTSGSTGRPKGVQVTHGNVARLFRATEAEFGFGPDDVWTLFHSYAFDFSVWELWGAWLYGGRLVVVPHDQSRDPEAFHALLRRERVTVLNQTPSAFRQLVHADAAAPAGLALRWVIFGGEALDPTTLRPWFQRHGDRGPRLVNMYGITETTVHVTLRPLTAEDAERPASLIGRPLADLQLYVVDACGDLAPIGVPGELYVGGAGVSRGYLNRPELTAARFVPRTAIRGLTGDAPLYRSGDLARLRPDGDFEYFGRIDHQVKIRGFRVELGEIEVALADHPSVREAAVLAHDGPDGHRFLVGYYVPAGPDHAPAVLRAHLLARLPEHMVPASLVALDALPLTANGKLDRQALSRRQPEVAAPRRDFVPPQTPEEALLVEVWEDALRTGPIGVYDNFFELGGDSILSIRVLARARQAGLDLSLPQLFRHPTIHALLRAAAVAAEPPPCTAPFDLCPAADRDRLPADVEDAYPLAALQAGMVVHGHLGAGTGVYHDIFNYRLRGALDLDALRDALAGVLAAHPILRTGFALTGYSQPLQLVHRAVPTPLTASDLSGLSPDEQERAIARWFADEKQRGFDPAVPPLLRAHVHRRGELAFDLSISFHHAILDGWSNARLLTELLQRYAASHDARVPPLAPGGSYRDFVAAEQAARRDVAHRDFWQQKLTDTTFLRLPRWPTAGADDAGGMRTIEIAANVSDGLRRLARDAHVPLKSALLAAHLRVLGILANQDDAQTGLVTHGRPEVEGGERTLGLFLNTVPLRLEIGDDSWLALARRAFEAEQELLPVRRYPVADIQKLAGGPVFESGFNFVHFHVLQQIAGVPGLELAGVEVFERHNYTLAAIFSVDPATRRLTVNLVYDAAALPPAQVQQIAALYERTLAAMAADPEASCRAASLLSPAERERLLVDFNRPGAEVLPAADRRALDLFAVQVARSPEAPAVVCPPATLTYRQLDARAARLVTRLRAIGVGRGAVVGVCLPRTAALVVGFLGVLAAGAAYLPLDPDYPPERLAYILADAGATALVTVPELAPRIAGASPHVVLLDDGEDPGTLSALATAVDAEDLAYVIYTSGTTGRPRGVQVPHRGLANLGAAQIQAFGVGPGARVLQFASPGFDASISEILMALGSGAALHMPGDASLARADIAELLRHRAITHVTLPPSLLAVLADVELPDLASVIAAGEACPPQLAARWGRGRRFFNAYGPTEATVCATIAEVFASDAAAHTLPIGAPIPGVRVYVLDERRTPVPLGTPGELYIGGLGVALGYHRQPESTAAKFCADPFGPGTLYRTGDVVRFLSDGRLEFVGRVDEQLKIRGFRVEPAEIAAVLREHPEVQDSVVVARDTDAGKQLVAHVVRRPASTSACELWPSVFEWPILDDLLYRAMMQDAGRMHSYEAAIRAVVAGRVVVEIGTGPTAGLTILCAQAGASKVYSIERDERAYQAARARIAELGLQDTVELICGDARMVQLPVAADVCVSAIVGSLAGSEGAAAILNGARHLLAQDGRMLPACATTRIAAVALPDALRAAPRFAELGRPYVQKIFTHVGRPFDLRVCVRNLPRSAILSSTGVLEHLDFGRVVPLQETHEVILHIEHDGRIDGLLAWLDLELAPGIRFDTLDGEPHSHLPVFLPAPEEGLAVAPGDTLHLTCTRSLSEDGLHPDYAVDCTLIGRDGAQRRFTVATPQLEPRHRGTSFYRDLFAHEDAVASGDDLRQFLRGKLPEHMVPARVVSLARMPMTPHGKIDRRALPDPFADLRERAVLLPQTDLEQHIAAIWREVLQVPQVGLHDNFFDLGGHSLLMMLVLGKLQETRPDIEMVELFEHPTVGSLAAHLRSRAAAPAPAAAPTPEPVADAPSAEEIRRRRLAARDQRRQARQRGTGDA